MPKHDTLAEHYKSKWEGQEQRCKEQVQTISELKGVISTWRKKYLDEHSRFCSSRGEIGVLKARLNNAQNELTRVYHLDKIGPS
jgi:hypothetical protein